jgi:hypothetical protein
MDREERTNLRSTIFTAGDKPMSTPALDPLDNFVNDIVPCNRTIRI